MLAAGLAALSGHSFVFMYAATLTAGLVCAGLALAWMYCWATNERAKQRQFGIGSLLFLTTFAAMYFAGIRWAVVQTEAQVGQRLPWGGIIGVGIGCTLLALMTAPAVLGVTESLMWFFVWLVRWPVARPLWRFWLRRRKLRHLPLETDSWVGR